MNDFIIHFFRSNPDGWKLKHFSIPHLIILLVAAAAASFLWAKRNELAKAECRKNDFWRKTIALVLALQFTVLYLWYGFTGFSGIAQSLPLYNCRFAIILTVIALITKNAWAQRISVYWGLPGSILALVLPDVDPFSWPHYINVSFVLGHVFLLLGVLYIVVVDRPKFSKQSLQFVITFSTLYHGAVSVLNYAVGGNYCLMREFPFGELPFLPNRTLTYTLFAIILYNVLMTLTHAGLRAIAKQVHKNGFKHGNENGNERRNEEGLESHARG